MKTKKNFNYPVLLIIFLLGLFIGYSPNLQKTKTFVRIHAPMGIELILRLSYLENAIHYELSVVLKIKISSKYLFLRGISHCL